MERRQISLVALALVATALCTGTTTAAAAAPPRDVFGGVFELRGTHGFKVLGEIGAKDGAAAMNLYVGRPREGAIYRVQGRLDGEEVDFDMGALGKVEVRAEPTGRKETVRPNCGKQMTLEAFDYVGTIEFHGEEGFTEAQAQRTPLRFDLLAEIGCGVSSEGEEFSALEPGARLKVARKGGPKLQINQNHPGAPVRYEARITERRPGLTIDRSVGGYLAGGAFHFDPTLTKASFAPGAPFAGSAIYRGSDAPRETHPAKGAWSGNLTVDFPGHAGAALTGPGFKAAIIRATRTESSP
jgi:hypothetical protein